VNNDDDMPTTVLTQITDALELHNEILAEHRNSIEQLIQENVELKKRLAKLEETDSSNSSNAKFIADITNRLAAISSAIDTKS
jgi:hypothetical protein